MGLESYQIVEQLYASERSVVHRAHPRAGGHEVVIKAPASIAGHDHVTRFRNEWLVYGALGPDYAVQPVELIEDAVGTALVLASPRRLRSLRERVKERRPSVRDSVRGALAIVESLAQLHARGVVHKDVKPDNIIVDERLSEAVIIDFGIAALTPRQFGGAMVEPHFQGTPAFMSPEQTGRIARAIDYRSDYYSVGATLYWKRAREFIGDPDSLRLTS